MDGVTLREIQRPLKDRYRADPAKALVTLRAEGSLASSEVACSVATGRALVEAGLHPATGGDGNLACSGDMLLQALVACAGVTLRSIATARGLDVSGTVRAEGDLDFRGTLGVDPEAPVGFRSIRLILELDSTATEEQLDELIATTERYCVVYQTLRSSPQTSAVITRTGGADGRPSDHR
ncbi:MAG TPA: OsmC family protein [Acidimicrobiales bacterium]|nr:OsmC family protein [Acidimicrobiales bacterium]